MRRAVLNYKQLPSAGLSLLGSLAAVGAAMLAREALELSTDETVVLTLVFMGALSFTLMGRLVNACSSWEPTLPDR
jgi:hypothetical protein